MHVRTFVLFLLVGLLSLPAAARSASDLVEKAKKEGEVIWYTTLSIPESREVADMFEKHHSFLKVKIVRSGGGALVNRVVSEFSAGAHIADVILGADSRGGVPVFKSKGIIAAYQFPNRKFVADELKDKDGFWTSMYQLTIALAYNKGMVNPGDVPKTYEDLLDPKWRGRKILNDSEQFVWFGTLLNHWGKEKGLAYFQKLAKQDQVFQRGARGRLQLVIAGEFPLTITYASHVQGYLDQGAPVEWVPLEPVVVSPLSILLAKNAPHPSAARLFIDFLFSKEVHEKLRDFKRIPSRTDVDADPPRLFKGFKKVIFNADIAADMPEITDLYKETFGLTR
jgi:ABC-type Fe3+ transport system substrate-binding protein